MGITTSLADEWEKVLNITTINAETKAAIEKIEFNGKRPDPTISADTKLDVTIDLTDDGLTHVSLLADILANSDT